MKKNHHCRQPQPCHHSWWLLSCKRHSRGSSKPFALFIKATLLVVLVSPWVLVWQLEAVIPSLPDERINFHWDHHPEPIPKVRGNNLSMAAIPQQYSCLDLFGSHQIVKNGTCLYHPIVRWVSCEISHTDGNNPGIWIDPGRIQGSVGGESIDQVLNRPEEEELLNYPKGSLLLSNDTTIPARLVQSVNVHLRGFLQSAVQMERPEGESNHVSTTTASAGGLLPGRVQQNGATGSGITLLVRRGNYANPCMALLTIYNVYIVLEHYYNYFDKETMDDTSDNMPLSIIWLDGYAKGDLDTVWDHLFRTQPVHVKQLGADIAEDNLALGANNATAHRVVPLSGRVMVVNTMSTIGDEGLGLYDWGTPAVEQAGFPQATTQACTTNSTLIQFRNFVLKRYGLSRKAVNHESPKVLTLLARRDYRAHPRSSGQTDRTLANVEADTAYLRTLYPSHKIQVVSFEGIPFSEQLQYMVSTDVLVAVHGAGSVHVLFLPDNATLVEYIPKPFRQRRRFRYLAECLGVTYISKPAWIEGRQKIRLGNSNDQPHNAKELIRVRLRPPAF